MHIIFSTLPPPTITVDQGSGMPHPNHSQAPYPQQPNPYHQQPPYNNQPAQSFGAGYPNTASPQAAPGMYPTFGGPPYPPQGNNNSAPYPTHAQHYQQATYPPGAIGGVSVCQHQYQVPQAHFGGYPNGPQFNNNAAPLSHQTTAFNPLHGGIIPAYGAQQPAVYASVYAAHQQRPVLLPAALEQQKVN